MKNSICILLSLFLSVSLFANTITAVTTDASPGDWTDGASWAGGAVPQSGDVVMIPAGTAVLISDQVYSLVSPPFLSLRVWGTLNFDPSGKLHLSFLSDIQIFLGGKIKPKNSSSSQLITIGGVTKYNASNNGMIQGPAIANALSGISLPGQPLSGFSPWALALKFKAFSGTETSGGITLKWETEEEVNAKEFTLERSDNGQTWSVVGSIPAKGIAASYSYIDYRSLSEILFYRIKTTDQNSQYHYSAVITIKKKILIDVFVTPNPVIHEMQVVLPKAPLGKITVTLLNSAGQPMLRTIITSVQNSFRLNLRTIGSGTYLLIISDNGEAIGKQMVVVK